MTQELAIRYESAPLAPVITGEQMDLITRTVAKDATPAELQLYLYDCQRHGVHPLDRLLHFTKRGGKYTPITSIDLLRSRAADTGELGGIEDARYQGEAATPDFTASVTVYRFIQGQRCPFTATARWSEYKPSDGQDHMWRKMPFLMLAKCSEALALRKAFPRQLAGLYAKEEMDQADNPVTHAPASYAPRLPERADTRTPLAPPAARQQPASNAPQCDVCGATGRPSKKGNGFYCPNKDQHDGQWYTIPEVTTRGEWDAIDEAGRPVEDDLL